MLQLLKNHLQIELLDLSLNPPKSTGSSNGYITKDDIIVGLYLSGLNLTQLTFIDTFESYLNSIEILDLSDNSITDIEPLKKLSNLKILSLNNNKALGDIKSLEFLHDLTEINLESNAITNIEPIRCLKKLEILNLENNNIESISSLANLISITNLKLSRNPISSFIPLSNLRKLKRLEAYSTFGVLKRLEISKKNEAVENINVNEFKFLANLSNLEILDLSYNVMSDISAVKHLINLESLNLSDNFIKDLTPIQSLTQLETLNLSNNLITDIRPLSKLKSLKFINLSENRLTDLRPLTYLENLHRLFLDKNGSSNYEILSSISTLTNLSLESNAIADIEFLKYFSNIYALWLKDNELSDIEPLKHLPKLSALDLRKNPIKRIPDWITGDNRKVFWKDEISWGVMLYDNPIESPPLAVVKRGNDSINRYFKKIREQGLALIYEAKLTLVGEGNAGKTSLQVRLLDAQAELPKNDSRTRGIKIVDWRFNKKTKKNCIIHIWDFGGQDVYYPVHRFFLTENSVFVLLASTRTMHHSFDYWIPTIHQFGGKSPIILGQTCHDGNKVAWNDLGDFIGHSDFNIIKSYNIPYIELNLPKRNEGLSKIRDAIITQIVNLPHYGKGIPKSWLTVKDHISKISTKSPCVSFDLFHQSCVDLSESGFDNLVDVEDCAKFLHSLGVLLWYYNHDDLKHWVILQPEWAMNAVYKIIDDDKIQKRNGNIIDNDFDRLWKDRHYYGRHQTLKKMLEVFKIAFPKKHKKNEYIIPARLVSMPTEMRWSETEPYLRLEYHYKFMPKGLVNQVSAELSRYLESDLHIWNNAVQICNESHTASCLIEENFYQRTIIVKSKGKDARGLIMLVKNALKDINDEYKGVEPDILVPCTCATCSTNLNPNMFSYENLIRWSSKRERTSVTCNESGTSVLIEELLYNVGFPAAIVDMVDKKTKRTIKLFLASSSELVEDRTQFEIFINRENKRLNEQNIFVELILWEDFPEHISSTRLQDEYNKAIIDSDIVVSLFYKHVGKYTAEEFEKALEKSQLTNKPFIYTYFKNTPTKITEIEKGIISLIEFKNKLENIGHFPRNYDNINELKYLFKMQFEKIINKF